MAAKKVEETIGTKENDKVTVILPPARDDEDNFLLVGVNGVMLKIKRGVQVSIPKAYKEVLDNASIQMKIVEEKKEKAAKKMA